MRVLYVFLSIVVLVLGGLVAQKFLFTKKPELPLGFAEQIQRPLDAYTIENLQNVRLTDKPIAFGEPIATASSYRVVPFSFVSAGKKVTGLSHLPLHFGNTLVPAIVQIRGYVVLEQYQPGIGTKKTAEVFASHGFASFAPDYLGYGSSDNPSQDVFEERFETYLVTLQLLHSLAFMPQIDNAKIGLWGHSNGGQIALTTLEITKKPYPTVLWAPVSKPFPYSILYYTDDWEDHGKLLRKKLAEFESLYDVEKYSLTNYIDRITAPLQIHQGDADTAVPITWSDNLVKILHQKHIDVSYFTYTGADHNLSGSWNTAVSRSVDFFTSHLTD